MNEQTISKSIVHWWAEHQNKWIGCKLCPLHKNAHKHVLFRGAVPCDILFIGEAPGETENTLGYPFIGRAGKMLDRLWLGVCTERMHTKSQQMSRRLGVDVDVAVIMKHPSYAITNTVACIPFLPENEIAPPPLESIEACSPRVDDFIGLAQPKLICLLGKVAERAFKGYRKRDAEYAKIPVIALQHPSYILRSGGEQSVDFKKWVHKLVGHIIEYKVGQHDNPKKEVRVRKATVKRKVSH